MAHKTVQAYPNPGYISMSSWVDCITKIIGWFQISDVRNPDTNNYLPETNASGAPVSGPGWVAYEKPNANPGDLVVIYKLWTTMVSGTGTPGSAIVGTLWDLINPGGLAYWSTSASVKATVSPTDIMSLLPHPGGVLTPNNPDNPGGDPDLLWQRVTTQYQLPGPGNIQTPQYIRQILPDFGLRTLFWTDACCTVSSVLNHPVIPPTLIPPPTPPPTVPPVPPTNPPVLVPTPGPIPNPIGLVPPSTPGEPQPHTWLGGGLTPTPGEDPPTNVTPSTTKDPTPGGPVEPEPTAYTPSVTSSSTYHRPGSGYMPRPGETKQPTYYGVSPLNPLPWLEKTSTQEPYTHTRAVPVSSRYLFIKEAGYDPKFMVPRVNWSISMDEETLASLGLIGGVAQQGTRGQVGGTVQSPAPSGRAGTNFANKESTNVVSSPVGAPSPTADPIRRHGSSPENPSNASSVGGYSGLKQRSLDDVTKEDTYRLPSVGSNQKVSRGRSRGHLQAKKFRKKTEKGRAHFDDKGNLALASTRRRSIDLSFATQATRMGSAQQHLYKSSGPAIVDLVEIKDAPSTENIRDPSGEFTINPIVYRGGPEWALLSLVIGDVQSEKHVVLNQTAYLHTDNGVKAANLGSSGVLQFGRVNPVQPGMYSVANPSCLPGQGSLPNIMAGGQSWNFMTLVLTLVNLENQVIAQVTMNFLPAVAGDTDVIAPNRLPHGLMRDLEITQSSNFLYDGTFNKRSPNQDTWYESEPSVVVERSTAVTNTVSVVLKATITSQGQNSPFRPLLEMYDDSTLQAGSNGQAGFVSGNCLALPGWVDPITLLPLSSGGVHTACGGIQGHGGAGGTSAYVVNQQGMIISGPYNPSVYMGTHNCYLHFRYDVANQADSNLITAGGNKYRIRVYNNGPATDLNGYALYTQGLKVSDATASLTVNSSGELDGSITTYHCSQVLRIRNDSTGAEIERLSSWEDGTVVVGANTDPNNRLAVSVGDIVKIYSPGYDNLYNSGRVVAEFTVE